MKKASKFREQFMRVIFMLAALAAISSVALICVFLFQGGIVGIVKIGAGHFLLGRDWFPSNTPPSYGILPMIIGSLYVTAGAIIVGVPIGIFTAVFMAEICPKNIYSLLKPAVDLLAGIPSVVYGFFGMVVLVPFVRDHIGGRGPSILTASILLGIMILPTVIGIAESSIRAVPRELYEGSLALGASKERSVFFVMLPAAKSGIMAAVVLGIGRAIGETMAVKMVAGNQAVMRAPNEFLMGVRTMTANVVMEMGYAEGLHKEALISTGLVLFVFILIINLLFSILNKGGEK